MPSVLREVDAGSVDAEPLRAAMSTLLDEARWKELSHAALERSAAFTPAAFRAAVEANVRDLLPPAR
jgi:hypothetical protein